MSKGLCCFSICVPGNVLVDTKEELMQIQGWACTWPARSQHAHPQLLYLSICHGTSPAVARQGKGPMQAMWHMHLHPWQAVLEFKPPESIMRFLSEIFLELLGCISRCRKLICKTQKLTCSASIESLLGQRCEDSPWREQRGQAVIFDGQDIGKKGRVSCLTPAGFSNPSLLFWTIKN